MKNFSKSVYTSDEPHSVLQYHDSLHMVLDEIESLTSGAYWMADGAGITDPVMAKSLCLVHVAIQRAAQAKELLDGLFEMHKSEINATHRGKEE